MTDIGAQYVDSLSPQHNSAEKALAISLTAKQLKDARRFLAAGQFFLSAHHAAWGVEPSELCPQFLFEAIDNLILFINSNPRDIWKEILALHLLRSNTRTLWFVGETATTLANIRDAATQRYISLLLAVKASDELKIAIMVSGFRLTGFLNS